MIADWVDDEFGSLDFGDARLNQRLKRCVTQFARIGESTPHACQNKADLKATYRFASNPKVTMSEILAEHNQASRQRCQQESLVYLVQDTTEVDLTKPQQQVAGAGPLGTDKRRGFFYHPLYALNAQGLALGVVDQVIWTRDESSLQPTAQEKKSARRRACFEEKESCRWLAMLQSGEQIARTQAQTTVVCLADSEADIGELLCETQDFPENFHLIIRGCHSRTIVSATDSATSQPLAASTLEEALALAQPRLTRTVTVGGRNQPVRPDDKQRSRKQARTKRQSSLSVKAITVTIAGPRRPDGGKLADVPVNVVEVWEENPPPGEAPIRWILLTTLPVATAEELTFVVESYCLRWNVETYFKTTKSGLRIEDLKYETLERYLIAFAMLSVVAWRVEYLKTAARTDPESSCEKYFTEAEWVAVTTFVTRPPVDRSAPPTMGEFLVRIAQLGGYINKKSQGPPGSRTIWRGMRQFETIVQAFTVFSQTTCGV